MANCCERGNEMILFFYQLDVQILYFNTFIIFLYMFRALLYSSSGGQLYESSIWYRHCFWVTSVHRLGESSRNLCTEESHKESDDTRCCVNIIFLLKMSTIVFETCRGI